MLEFCQGDVLEEFCNLNGSCCEDPLTEELALRWRALTGSQAP